jgi:hypothetical protein
MSFKHSIFVGTQSTVHTLQLIYYLLLKIEIYMNQIHNINTTFSSDLHTPTANLTTFQKGPFYFGMKVFNHLPTNIKKTSRDINQFRSSLKSFLVINSFYLLEEYFARNSNRDLGLV